MTTEARLRRMLAPLGAVEKKMFGGVCFMIRGNMLAGTSKRGLLVRTGKAAHADALKRPGAATFDMRGKPIAGYVIVDDAALAGDAALRGWIDLALAHAATLPAKAEGKPAKPRRR